jgi:hypothetical protein
MDNLLGQRSRPAVRSNLPAQTIRLHLALYLITDNRDKLAALEAARIFVAQQAGQPPTNVNIQR